MRSKFHNKLVLGLEVTQLSDFKFQKNSNRFQGNAFTEMFDRLKAENEQRKVEVHGLKDILVRENDHRIRETDELRMAMELSAQKLGEALERECNDMDQVKFWSTAEASKRKKLWRS